MAISENVNINVRANSKQAQQGFKQLKGSVDKFGGSMTSAFFSFNQGIMAAQTAMRGLKQIMEFAEFRQEVVRMEQMVGRDLALRIQEATGGTISQMDAMRGAAKAMAGELGLSADQIVTITAAADDLGKRFGKETIQIVNDLTVAFKTGRTQSLAQYGIDIEGIKGKAEKMAEAMKQLNHIVSDPTAANAYADNVDRMKVKAQDFADQVKNVLGTAVIWLGSKMADLNEELDKFVDQVLNLGGQSQKLARDAIKKDAFSRLAKERGAHPMALQRILDERRDPELEARFVEIEQKLLDEAKAMQKQLINSRKRSKEEAEQTAANIGDVFEKWFMVAENAAQKAKDAQTQSGKKKTVVVGPKGTVIFDAQSDILDQITASLGAMSPQMLEKRRLEDQGLQALAFGASRGGDSPEAADFRSESQRAADLRAAQEKQGMHADDQLKEQKRLSDEVRLAREQEMESFQTSATAGLSIMGSVFGKRRELIVAEALLMGGMETARAFSAFALPGGQASGLAHLAAAAAYFKVAHSKATGGGGGGGQGARAAGGGFVPASSASGGGGQTIIVQVGQGFVGDAHGLAEEIDHKIRGARRAGRIEERGAVHG